MPIKLDRGDVIYMDFTPQAGHEQAGRRPAVVVSPAIYNTKSSLCLVMPVTTKIKGYPFEVPVGQKAPIEGVILSDQIKSLNVHARNPEKIGRLERDVINQALANVRVLLK